MDTKLSRGPRALIATSPWEVMLGGFSLGSTGAPKHSLNRMCRSGKGTWGINPLRLCRITLEVCFLGSGWSEQDALDQCHLGFCEWGWGEQSKRDRREMQREQTPFSLSLGTIWGSGHGAGIPIPGKSHEHMEEREHGKDPEAAFLPSDSDSQFQVEGVEAQEDTAASSRPQS